MTRRQASVEARCRAEGEEVRKLGGLYVLGSASATRAGASTTSCGAVPAARATRARAASTSASTTSCCGCSPPGPCRWVMGRTLPEDVPIESKTVAKAIERAQNTVEARNAEMRKDALKYDEVMDQQRKVIYERRLQIIDGDDLEEHTEDLLAGAAEKLVAEHCPTEFEEDWDLKALVDGLTQYYPTKFTVADLSQAATTEELVESIVEEALEYYEQHAEAMPGGAETMRQIERDVYLQIMDARWRDHLAEMDNLKDGIHLRWTVQADPLNAWQQEGYSMFGQLIEVIDNDYLRYILHVEAVQQAGGRARPGPGGLRRRRRPGGRDRRAGRCAGWPSRGDQCRRRRRSRRGAARPGRPVRATAPNGSGRRRGRGKAQVKQPATPDPDATGADRQGAAREDRAQRALLVRERQEVQVLPWRRLTARGPAEAPRDFTAELEALAEPGWPRPSATWGWTSSRPGGPSSKPRRREPDLWDDARQARSITKELGQVTADLDQLTGLRGDAQRRPGAARADRRVGGRTARRDASLETELVETVDGLRARLGALELQSLFSGEYDEHDAVVRSARRRRRHRRAGLDRDAAAHVPALGRTARLHGRGRRGDGGPGGGAAVGHLHRARALRLRAAGHRARRAPAGAHVALRLAAPAPDQLRLPRRDALPRGRIGRGGDRREGPAHRHLPLVGGGRPAREQDGLGRAPHPPARPGWSCRARTSAASTRTRPRPCRSSGPSWPSGPGTSGGPRWTR